MKKPISKLGFVLAGTYILVALLIIGSYDGCDGGVMFCEFQYHVWMAAAPWSLPFIFGAHGSPPYFGMFVLSGIGVFLNITILYYIGRIVEDEFRKGTLP